MTIPLEYAQKTFVAYVPAFIRLSLLIPMWAISTAFGATAALDYSSTQLKQISVSYVRTVWGKKPPTLANYLAFETRHDETEWMFELRACARKWGDDIGQIEKGSDVSIDCAKWITQRDAIPEDAPSLYYAFLRRTVKVDGSGLRVISIRPHRTSGPDQLLAGQYPERLVRLTDKRTGVELTLVVAANRRTQNTGTVRLALVNGQPIQALIKQESAFLPNPSVNEDTAR